MDLFLSSLVVLCLGQLPVGGFNVETEGPVVFSQSDLSEFGYSVALFNGGNENWTLVGAPLTVDGKGVPTGAVYKCRYREKSCVKLSLPAPTGTNNIGLSMSTGGNHALVCAPRFTYECYTNTYINGFCYMIDSTLARFQRVPEKLPECPKVQIDMAFLIDGSGSVQSYDFTKIKEFVKALMQKFSNKDTQIAVVQFSSQIQKEFDFNKYNLIYDKMSLVQNIRQLRGGTNTPAGIKYVADSIFTPYAGARKTAKRILITITDGESYQKNFQQAINAANSKNIVRYAIGVGSAFSSSAAKTELETIASKEDNVFQVNDFQALDNIKNELQEKIFAIEGTDESGVSSFQLEMAQEGMSSMVTNRASVLGAVGAYDWSGGIWQIEPRIKTFINESANEQKMKNSYMGYSLKEARSSGQTYYVVGAPRYLHRGRVLVYRHGWTPRLTDRLDGQQIGSYFGSELCSVDLDGDTITDLILIAAPLYRGASSGGLVTIYRFKDGHLTPLASLKGRDGSPLSRFGTSLAQLGDLNGDGLADVAVGAPLEEGGSGALYIFHGTSSSLSTQASQWVRSADLAPGLRYFGRSIHGALDVSGDGLTDIVVGALGKVFIFRSRPVVDVQIQSSFNPTKIKLKDVDCPENSPPKPMVDGKMCFILTELTRKLPDRPTFTMNYTVVLDSNRKVQRGELKSPTTGHITLTNGFCLNFRIQLDNCIQDNFNPIQLEVTFTAEGQRTGSSPAPILRKGSTGTWSAKLPFEKECGVDEICTDRLNVDFALAGSQVLVVGSHSTITIDVTLENTGENSYFTMVTFLIPEGLSFRKTSIIKSSRRSHIKCDDSQDPTASGNRAVRCQVSHPIFRTNSTMVFNTTFDVNSQADWKDAVEISVNATSDNEARDARNSFKSKRVGVKYEVNVIIKGIKSTQYINFTTDKVDTKLVTHSYEVENIDRRSLPVQISLFVPVRIRPGLTWERVQLTSSQQGETSCQRDTWKPEQGWQTCNSTVCDMFICNIKLLRFKERPRFIISGNVTWINPGKTDPQEVKMISYASVGYETTYIHVSQATERFKRATVTTRVELVKEVNMLPIIVGSSVGGLILLLITAGVLYKVGFFKRGYKEKMDEANDETEQGGAEPPASET